jgi:hypothetical protein
MQTRVRQCKLDLSAGDPQPAPELAPPASPGAATNPPANPVIDPAAASIKPPSTPEMALPAARPASTPEVVLPPAAAAAPVPTRLRSCKLVTGPAEDAPAAELSPAPQPLTNPDLALPSAGRPSSKPFLALPETAPTQAAEEPTTPWYQDSAPEPSAVRRPDLAVTEDAAPSDPGATEPDAEWNEPRPASRRWMAAVAAVVVLLCLSGTALVAYVLINGKDDRTTDQTASNERDTKLVPGLANKGTPNDPQGLIQGGLNNRPNTPDQKVTQPVTVPQTTIPVIRPQDGGLQPIQSPSKGSQVVDPQLLPELAITPPPVKKR